jgi:hypothetical protein
VTASRRKICHDEGHLWEYEAKDFRERFAWLGDSCRARIEIAVSVVSAIVKFAPSRMKSTSLS